MGLPVGEWNYTRRVSIEARKLHFRATALAVGIDN